MCGEANQTDTGIPPNPPPPRLGNNDFGERRFSRASRFPPKYCVYIFARVFPRLFQAMRGAGTFFSQELFTNLFLHDPRQILLPSFRVQFRCVRQKFSFSLVDPSIIARRLGRFWRRTRKRTGPLKRIYTVQFYIV